MTLPGGQSRRAQPGSAASYAPGRTCRQGSSADCDASRDEIAAIRLDLLLPGHNKQLVNADKVKNVLHPGKVFARGPPQDLAVFGRIVRAAKAGAEKALRILVLLQDTGVLQQAMRLAVALIAECHGSGADCEASRDERAAIRLRSKVDGVGSRSAQRHNNYDGQVVIGSRVADCHVGRNHGSSTFSIRENREWKPIKNCFVENKLVLALPEYSDASQTVGTFSIHIASPPPCVDPQNIRGGSGGTLRRGYGDAKLRQERRSCRSDWSVDQRINLTRRQRLEHGEARVAPRGIERAFVTSSRCDSLGFVGRGHPIGEPVREPGVAIYGLPSPRLLPRLVAMGTIDTRGHCTLRYGRLAHCAVERRRLLSIGCTPPHKGTVATSRGHWPHAKGAAVPPKDGDRHCQRTLVGGVWGNGVVRLVAAGHVYNDTAERPDVDRRRRLHPRVDLEMYGFRGTVPGGVTLHRHGLLRDGLGRTKVPDLGRVVLVNHHVGRFEVVVDDRVAVEEPKTFQYLTRELSDLGDVVDRFFFAPRFEVTLFGVLDVRVQSLSVAVVEPQEVWVFDPTHQLPLAPERLLLLLFVDVVEQRCVPWRFACGAEPLGINAQCDNPGPTLSEHPTYPPLPRPENHRTPVSRGRFHSDLRRVSEASAQD
eukprot:m.400892 g.400892  ORF g.400892 m.400892 type:complete len:650 (-) comp28393_c0_seq4:5112-7061(-)